MGGAGSAAGGGIGAVLVRTGGAAGGGGVATVLVLRVGGAVGDGGLEVARARRPRSGGGGRSWGAEVGVGDAMGGLERGVPGGVLSSSWALMRSTRALNNLKHKKSKSLFN